MGYYYRPSGDYRTGGYGQQMGDPGLFSFIGKAASAIWKVAKPIIASTIGGPIGAIATGTAIGTTVSKFTGPGAVGPPAPPSMPGVGMIPVAGQAVARGAVAGAYAGGVCPSGYHPAKDGSGRCVRNRRMNIANPRALRRSMRRVKGFEKLARKTISFTKRVRIKS